MHAVNAMGDAWVPNRPSVADDCSATTGGSTSAVVLDNLMEKIRSRANQYRVWPELIKMSRTAMLDKRGLINDVNERNQLEKCLDTIQKNIKITSLQSMIERLETITRQLGLKFTAGPTGKDVFISSDMFYVEVVLEPSTGHVKDVKIAHQADPESCLELIRVLREGDFAEFTRHLEGLSAIYQLNCDKKQKSKAYTALHSLENDLTNLAQVQSAHLNDPNSYVHKTPVGLLESRKGGHSMKLTYFVSPYDLLDRKTKGAVPLTLDVVIERKLGYSATICIESSDKTWKLQNQNLINLTHGKDGKTVPSFSALTNLNSSVLPAYFVLKLPKSLPVSLEVIKKVHEITGIEWVAPEAMSKSEPLVGLIAKQILPEKEKQNANLNHNNHIIGFGSFNGPFFVKLPDQEHCYHVNDGLTQLDGIAISSVPFLHPTHVPQILVLLRQQVLFNVIVGSCIRKLSSFNSNDTQLSFEVTTQSMTNVCVSFEHPVEESLATLDVDMRDITNVKCKLYNANSFANLCSDEYASKVMQKSLSIPITLRQIILKCQEKAAALREQQLKHQQQMNNKVNQNDIYNFSNSMNGGTNGSNGQSDISSYLSQQLLANQFRQNSANVEASNNDPQQQLTPQQQQLTAMMNQIKSSSAAQGQSGQQQQNNLRQRLALQQLQQQQQQLQKQVQQMSTAVTQQQQAQQQKQNHMLMSMLSDIPAANSQKQQQQLAYNATVYQQQQQQQQQQSQQQMSMNDYQEQLQQLQQLQQHTQQQQGQKPKKQRKRKGDTGNRSPGSSTGRSPKRKLSDDDYSRDLPTPSSDSLMDAFGDLNQNSRPSSTASSSTPNYEPSNTPRSQEQMLSLKPEPGSSGSLINIGDVSAEFIANYQYQLSRSISAPGGASSSELDFPDMLGFDVPDFGPSSTGSSQGKGKKRASRKSSDGYNDGVSGSMMMDDGSGDPMSLKSLQQAQSDDSNQGPDGSMNSLLSSFAAPSAKIAKGGRVNSNDGRRCSSAGLGDGGLKRGGFGNGPFDEPGSAAVKKERKRKRAESVDSLKMANAGSVSLMPPPLISSTGEVTTSGSGLIAPAAAYAFMDVPPNGAPALRPITLNVKPMIPSSTTSNSMGLTKSPNAAGNSGRKTPSAVSSSAGHPGQRKLEGGGMRAKGLPRSSLELNGSALPGGSKLGAKVPRVNKISSSKGPSPSPTKGLVKQGLKLKSGSQVTSSSSASLPKQSTTSPPVSSSSSQLPALLSPLNPSASGVSSTKQSQSSSSSSQNNNQAKPSSVLPQKKKVGLSSIIDKLTKGSVTVPGGPQVPDGDAASTTSQGGGDVGNRPESTGGNGGALASRPDSSSCGKATGTAGSGGASSSGGKIGESKMKYSRAAGEFTVKQSAAGTGLKLSITKTKPSSSTEFKLGLKSKLPNSSSAGVKSAASSSGVAGKQTKGPGGGGLMKRPTGTPTYKPGTGFNKGNSGGVSSSSGSNLTSPKAGSGLNSSPKLGQAGRPLGNGKVSSSGSGGSGPSKSGKISSSSGEAILQAALPTLRIENLPKIPRTAQANAVASSAAVASSQQVVSQSSQPQTLSSPSVNTSILPQPTKRVVPRVSQEAPTPSQPEASARLGELSSSDRFQSNAITSSYLSSQLAAQSQEAAAISSSGSGPEELVSQQQQQLLQSSSSTSSSSTTTTTTSSSAIVAPAPSISVAAAPDEGIASPPPLDKGGVSSSSDTQATSTPSSPVEAASIVDVLPNAPLIIPTESFEEPDQLSDHRVEPSRQPTQPGTPSIDSTDNLSVPPLAAFGIARENISSTSHQEFSSGSATPLPSSATRDDDDDDGLVIDFPATPSKSVEGCDSAEIVSQGDPVSSSNAGPASGPCSPRPRSPLAAPVLSSSSLTPPACSSATPSQEGSNNGNAPSSSSLVVAAPGSPNSNQASSAVPAASARSPYASIDDDLMDEALVSTGD